MVELAAQAAASPYFDEKPLRLSSVKIPERPYGDGNTFNLALEEGWKHGVSHAMADGIVTHAKEVRLDAW